MGRLRGDPAPHLHLLWREVGRSGGRSRLRDVSYPYTSPDPTQVAPRPVCHAVRCSRGSPAGELLVWGARGACPRPYRRGTGRRVHRGTSLPVPGWARRGPRGEGRSACRALRLLSSLGQLPAPGAHLPLSRQQAATGRPPRRSWPAHTTLTDRPRLPEPSPYLASEFSARAATAQTPFWNLGGWGGRGNLGLGRFLRKDGAARGWLESMCTPRD